jgi:hypothetical protein
MATDGGLYCGGSFSSRNAANMPAPADTASRRSAALDASAFQDLVEVLPDLLKISAGIPLQFHLSVTLGDGQEVSPETVGSVNQLLEQVNTDLRLTRPGAQPGPV